MPIKRLLVLLLIVGFTACATKGSQQSKPSASVAQSSGTGTLIIPKIVFAEQSHVRDAVRNECQLPEKLTTFITQYAEHQYAHIGSSSTSKSAGAQTLSIEIIDLSGAKGGAWSGGKMVMIKGKLTQGGRLIGNFNGRRISGGGVWGGYKGTCAILGRCVKALGKDVANWLTDPAKGSVIGDM